MKDDIKDVGFYNPFDGLKGRDGGPYLDAENRRKAEIQRALVEDREPADLNGTLPADAGTPLVTAANVIDNSVNSNPSMAARTGFDAILTDEAMSESSSDFNPNLDEVGFAGPISVLPVDFSTEAPDDDDTDESDLDPTDPQAPTNAQLNEDEDDNLPGSDHSTSTNTTFGTPNLNV